MIPSSEPHHDLPGTDPIKVVQNQEEIQERYSDYLYDESRMTGNSVDALIFANSEKQVIETLRSAYRTQTAVTVSAGRTGIVGGAIPIGGNLLSLEKMKRFRGVRWDEEQNCWCVRIEPGITLKELERLLVHKQFDTCLGHIKEEEREALMKFTQESDRWFYPVDPTEKTAHIGGTVATNASGARSFKYGQTRNYVSGLRIVLSDGSVLSLQRGQYITDQSKGFDIQTLEDCVRVPLPRYKLPSVKNAAGFYITSPMDLLDLFIGNEGTLGVITEIELMLKRRPEMVLGCVAFFPSEYEAFQFVGKVRSEHNNPDNRIAPSVLEYIDGHALNLLRKKRLQDGSASVIPSFPDNAGACIYFEQEGKSEDLEYFCLEYAQFVTDSGGDGDQTWGGFDEKEREKISAFRHAVPEEINARVTENRRTYPEIHKVGTDFVVPAEQFESLINSVRTKLDSSGMEYVIFGHIGDNHLHINMLPDHPDALMKAKDLAMDFAAQAVSLGGTVSGEHGIGKLKKSLLKIMFDDKTIDEMKQLKEALDPKGLLNKGNFWD